MSARTAPLPFEPISPWVDPPDNLQPPLESDRRTDVVVIGAGYTGLATALALRAQGIEVTVLEQDFAGAGASGRNAGHLTPTIGKDIPTLLRLFGAERAANLVRFADAAVEHTEEVIRNYDIDCEYEARGNILAGVHPKHEARLRRAAEAARGAGARVRFVPESEMRALDLPGAFYCGVLEELGGHLHPGRYVMGLRRAALDAGAKLFEGTRVTGFDSGSPVEVRTQSGSVRADAAVVATNAYTPQLGWRRRAVAPLRVSLFETAPLSEAQLAEIGWSSRQGIYTSHEILESYRLTPRGTIVGGSKAVRHDFGDRLPDAYESKVLKAIEAAFRERFPSLDALPIRTFWGGWIALTIDFLPSLLADEPERNTVGGLGYCGHGVAQATLMGEMLAERVQGRAHPWESALHRRDFRWPPEPIRWLAGSLLNGILAAIDRRTDRQIRALRRR